METKTNFLQKVYHKYKLGSFAVSPQQPATNSRAMQILIHVGETVFALLMLGVGYAAYATGDFFVNTIYLMLFAAAFVVAVIFVVRVALHKIHFGLLIKPFDRESRRYWLAAVPRLAFYASCGYLLTIAIVPCQFPDHSQSFIKLM